MLALVGLWSVVASVLVIAALDAWTWNWPRSPVTRTISEYAQGPLAWPFHLAVLALAFGSLAVGTAMVRQRLAHRMSGGLLALGLWSAGLVLVVVFEKHDWSQGPSTSGYIHQLSSLTAFIALPVAGVLLARPWRGDDRWRTWARRTGGLALVSMLWFVPIVGAVFISVATDLAWWRIVPLGLAERLLTLTEVLVVLALGGWTLAAAVPEAVENTTAEN
ncbi:uncharacterized protein DUF998 [Stackebrandtia albiflava]|uniref:Uncharacterized protein DUF998 n=1 Tax=Stackebrandtia albiflava TaxID=406432 RepID=A0A562VB27_9ACTN|nr:DUF998 domain-containing protein [Stackebrandtia albiflava]TWJ15051.1 uncharacterized protein DUF998 [Stackebrandtia albiflava]